MISTFHTFLFLISFCILGYGESSRLDSSPQGGLTVPPDLERYLEEVAAETPAQDKVIKEPIQTPEDLSKQGQAKPAKETAISERGNAAKTKPAASAKNRPVFEIGELFSVEHNPGRGVLLFTQGEHGETIQFGKETGHYGVGLVFDSGLLPQPHRHEFGKKLILQIALGTMKSRLLGKVPQFGILTIFSRDIPKVSRNYSLRTMPVKGKGSKVTEGGLLMFGSPNSAQEQSDENKLRGTYFAKGGTATFRTASEVKSANAIFRGERLRFKAQMMEVKFEATLVTPFNNEMHAALEGTIVFPIYWPANREAQALTDELAFQSLNDRGRPLEGSTAPRKLSGSRP